MQNESGGAPRVGFEPTTLRLTAACSTVELPRKETIVPQMYTPVPVYEQEIRKLF